MTRRMTTGQDDIQIAAGTTVAGKWHGHRYQILKWLGSGAQGTVYLARSARGTVAIKFAKDQSSLISEVNVLKKFAVLQGEPLGPSLFDTDDWQMPSGRRVSFYAMEHLSGAPMNEGIRAKSFDWTCVFILQLLTDLQRLHQSGYVFGDLKPENLIITLPHQKVRCLDFGGATMMGRSVKEYTEFFDRGYWGMGTRKAEPSYDLFSVGMIVIDAAVGKRFQKSEQAHRQLMRVIKEHHQLYRYQNILQKAIDGRYGSANEMRREFLAKLNETETSYSQSRINKRNGRKRGQSVSHGKSRGSGWMGALTIATFIFTIYILYVMVYIM